jgi:hypothetical protein
MPAPGALTEVIGYIEFTKFPSGQTPPNTENGVLFAQDDGTGKTALIFLAGGVSTVVAAAQ